MPSDQQRGVTAAVQGTLAHRLGENSSESATVEALGLHNSACCEDAHVCLPERCARARRMTTDNCLEAGCIGLDECTALVFNFGQNTNAEEEFRLAELNAPEKKVGKKLEFEVILCGICTLRQAWP